MISIVIPLYKCRDNLVELNNRLLTTLDYLKNDYEIIYINDASPEDDWMLVELFAGKNSKIRGINLSRNFGQHPAITAGLTKAKGDWIIVMDGDLQDQPEEIIKLYKKATEGYDIVIGQRIHRRDNWLKRKISRFFYKVFSYLTDTEQDPTIANFGIYHRRVITAVLNMQDYIRFLPSMIKWVGFKSTKIEVQHASREHGKTSYSFKKLLKLAFFTITSFSNRPLLLIIKFGVFVSFFSFCVGIFYLSQYLSGRIKVSGFASIIISLWFISGIIISLIGILGLYIGNIFEKVKNRPMFIIEKTVNFE
ncbi:MAG: glycosyltransferase family 2 protein [Desulfobacterales bacterium]|nr:glycosyltransferase family 2 protein [Desulfobacterales bacterium]